MPDLSIPTVLPRARVKVTLDDPTQPRHGGRLGVVEVTHDGTTITARKPGGSVRAQGVLVRDESIGQDAWRVYVEGGSWAVITQDCGCGG